METLCAGDFSQRGSVQDYLAIARLDHAAKHIFIVPSLIVARASLPNIYDLPTFKVVIGSRFLVRPDATDYEFSW
jgi:hypothetical protein